MNATLVEAVFAASAGAFESAAMPGPASTVPIDGWPESAVDACAPEGGYCPFIAAARAGERWS
jgi:hypothetical protein